MSIVGVGDNIKVHLTRVHLLDHIFQVSLGGFDGRHIESDRGHFKSPIVVLHIGLNTDVGIISQSSSQVLIQSKLDTLSINFHIFTL